jgi:signal transduction histidine kinase
MRRWLPRSLFSRMVLILLAGLVLAQAASLALYWRDRDEFIQRALGMRSVQRIADILGVLDSTAPEERKRIIAVVNSPQLRVALDVAPIAVAGNEEAHDQARSFARALRRSVGDERPLSVTVVDAPFLRGPPAGYGPGMKSGAGGNIGGGWGMGGGGMAGGVGGGPMAGGFAFAGLSFVVQTRLADGTPVTFDSRQTRDAIGAPYRLMLSLGLLLGAVVVLALLAVRWVTKPLETLALAAERLGEDIRRPPLDESGPLEASRAARAFNTMQRELVKFIDDRTRILAAMSHDLKTPITRLRLRAELLDDPSLRARFEADLDEMQAMVGRTLEVMRGLDREAKRTPIDVLALLHSLQDDMRVFGAEVEVEGTAAQPYSGSPDALKRCLQNVIENAIKYGSSARVIVTDRPHELEIRVIDKGPGIPDDEIERVFEPFYRLEVSRNRESGGTGLGLTIARNLARARGGELCLRNRVEGGLEAVLTLPRERVEAANVKGVAAQAPLASSAPADPGHRHGLVP